MSEDENEEKEKEDKNPKQSIKQTLKKIQNYDSIGKWLEKAGSDMSFVWIFGTRFAEMYIRYCCEEGIRDLPKLDGNFYGSCFRLMREKKPNQEEDEEEENEEEKDEEEKKKKAKPAQSQRRKKTGGDHLSSYFYEHCWPNIPPRIAIRPDQSQFINDLAKKAETNANTMMRNYEQRHDHWCHDRAAEMLPPPEKGKGKEKESDERGQARNTIYKFLHANTAGWKGKSPDFARLRLDCGEHLTDEIVSTLRKLIAEFMSFHVNPRGMLPVTIKKLSTPELKVTHKEWAKEEALRLIPERADEFPFRTKTRDTVRIFLWKSAKKEVGALSDEFEKLERDCEKLLKQRPKKDEPKRRKIYTKEFAATLRNSLANVPAEEIISRSSWYLPWIWRMLQYVEKHNEDPKNQKDQLRQFSLLPISKLDRISIPVTNTSLFMLLFHQRESGEIVTPWKGYAGCAQAKGKKGSKALKVIEEWIDKDDLKKNPAEVVRLINKYTTPEQRNRSDARREFNLYPEVYWRLCFDIEEDAKDEKEKHTFANYISSDGVSVSLLFNLHRPPAYRRSDALREKKGLKPRWRFVKSDERAEGEDSGDAYDGLDDECDAESEGADEEGREMEPEMEVEAEEVAEKKLSVEEWIGAKEKAKQTEFHELLSKMNPDARIISIDPGKRDVFTLVEPMEDGKYEVRQFSGGQYKHESGANKLSHLRRCWNQLEEKECPGYIKWLNDMPTTKSSRSEDMAVHLRHLSLNFEFSHKAHGRKAIRSEKWRNYRKRQVTLAKMVRMILQTKEEQVRYAERKNKEKNIETHHRRDRRQQKTPYAPRYVRMGERRDEEQKKEKKKQVVLVMGAARFACVGPVEQLRTELIRLSQNLNDEGEHDVLFYSMDEFNTSKLANCCAHKEGVETRKQVLAESYMLPPTPIPPTPPTNPKRIQKLAHQKTKKERKAAQREAEAKAKGEEAKEFRKKKKDINRRALYAVKACASCRQRMNRDVNAAINMHWVFKFECTHQGQRPKWFRRLTKEELAEEAKARKRQDAEKKASGKKEERKAEEREEAAPWSFEEHIAQRQQELEEFIREREEQNRERIRLEAERKNSGTTTTAETMSSRNRKRKTMSEAEEEEPDLPSVKSAKKARKQTTTVKTGRGKKRAAPSSYDEKGS